MQIITGRICRLLHNSADEVNGFALESGVDVHFPPSGAKIEALLARVQWVTQHGTMPSEDRAQVERLSSWSERLCRWARRLLETGSTQDGIEFAQAADAAVYSAEHLCRKCYVTRSSDPHSAELNETRARSD